MTEFDFAKKIHDLGGRAYLVGGAVRDKFRGVHAHDRDYCVAGVEEKIFAETFPNAAKFGKSFPVYSVEIDGNFCEVAFARTERKVGTGYRGFEVVFAPTVTIEQDLFRRDTTINAMAIEILTQELVDPFGGREDVLNKKIRAVSEHFTDDPVRALRAARQAAQFNFEICAETIEAMRLCGTELANEPTERIFDELETALKTDKPSIFFRNLERANLLEITFPEIFNLRGKIQLSCYHPEGDAYEHTLQIVDDVAKVNSKPMVRFAALMHDIGKLGIPEEILNKPAPLTDDEWKIMRNHPRIGTQILEPLNSFREILPWIEYHHERLDGNGYYKIPPEELNTATRMIALADTYCAITMRRSYKNPRTYEDAVSVFKKVSGTQLDPVLIDIFLTIPKEALRACVPASVEV